MDNKVYWLLGVFLCILYNTFGVLLPFVVGSFCVVNSTFNVIVLTLIKEEKDKTAKSSKTFKTHAGIDAKYNYDTYTLYQPLMVGSFNALGAYLSAAVGFTGIYRYLLTWALCHSLVLPLVIFGKFYKFESISSFLSYFSKQVIVYGIAIFGICQLVENAITSSLLSK